MADAIACYVKGAILHRVTKHQFEKQQKQLIFICLVMFSS